MSNTQTPISNSSSINSKNSEIEERERERGRIQGRTQGKARWANKQADKLSHAILQRRNEYREINEVKKTW